MSVEDRIGTTSIPIDPEKVVGIVESDYPDQTSPNTAADDTSRAIAGHLIEFLEHEVAHGRLPASLLPLQSGIGNIANAVIGGLETSNFRNLKVWTEVIQDTFLDLFDSGRLDFATATSVRFSPEGFKRFYDNWEAYHGKLLLRSQQVSNSPEIIRRLGIIGMNTPVEVDIYAHANSTCVMGSRMLNGLGGSADFLRSAKYSIMHTPSTRPSKADPHGVSCIVPMCTHVDQTEHDLDVIVTENGLADVRGLSPRERARVIIDKCAHNVYKPILQAYFDKAEFECLRKGWGHEPHLLWNSFDMHKALNEEGSMRKVNSWGGKRQSSPQSSPCNIGFTTIFQSLFCNAKGAADRDVACVTQVYSAIASPCNEIPCCTTVLLGICTSSQIPVISPPPSALMVITFPLSLPSRLLFTYNTADFGSNCFNIVARSITYCAYVSCAPYTKDYRQAACPLTPSAIRYSQLKPKPSSSFIAYTATVIVGDVQIYTATPIIAEATLLRVVDGCYSSGITDTVKYGNTLWEV